MTLRFRQHFKLFPGVRLNVAKRGVSVSFGAPGATVNVGARGVRSTVGVPGSGLSYSTQLARFDQPATPQSPEPAWWQPPPPPKTPDTASRPYIRSEGTREIGSAAIESLTSEGLADLHRMITDARGQRSELQTDLADAKREHDATTTELTRRRRSLFRFFYRRRMAELEDSIPTLTAEVVRLEGWLDATHIDVAFNVEPEAQKAYGALVRGYEALRKCTTTWDVTADRATNKFVERTLASKAIDRRPVVFDYSGSDLVRFQGRAMRFGNANGEDILIYPGMILMPRADGAFALLDIREITVTGEPVPFIEGEQVPADTKVIGETWAKTNKDGSPDRRFRDNYRIPVCQYGELSFRSRTGLREDYHVSNAEAAIAFATAFDAYRQQLVD